MPRNEEAANNMSNVVTIPPSFKDYFQKLLGDELDIFLNSLHRPPAHFLRINTLKQSLRKGLTRLANLNIDHSPLPWFPAGFRITGDHASLPFTKEYSLGYYYIQEGGSMLPPVAMDPRPGHSILDMCAAPGSKTTQIAQMMQNQGVIIANDRNYRRISSLGHNLQLTGVANTLVLCEDGRQLPQRIDIQFDRVLVDAPCTASGHLRSKPLQFETPDKHRITGLQALQKGLLTAGFRLLKPGGHIIYSTCSLYPQENEAIIDHLIKRFTEASIMHPQISGLKSHPGIVTWDDEEFDTSIEQCLRVYPHDNDTDGFFVALIRKEDV
jgi:NOL1/NOP2/sun family putative RNA methylase